jgi:hypothetical protein
VRITWTLGCSNISKLKIFANSPGCSATDLLNGTCSRLDSIEVTATASAATGWVKACGLDGIGFTPFSNEPKFREYPDGLFMIFNFGIFRSVNDGGDWERITAGSVNSFGSDFHIDAAGNWYACFFSEGIFKSTNKGQTWTPLTQNIIFINEPRNFLVKDNTYSMADLNNNGLIFSTNSGQNWSNATVSSGSAFVGSISNAVVLNSGTYFFWSNDFQRFLKSSDNGVNWTSINVPASLIPFTSSIVKTDDDKLVYLNESGGFKIYLYNTTNNTGTSKSLTSVHPSGTGLTRSLNYQDGKVYFLALDNSFTNGKIFTDDGTNLGSFTEKDLNTPIQKSVFYVTKSGKFLIGNQDGLFVFRN